MSETKKVGHGEGGRTGHRLKEGVGLIVKDEMD